MISRRAALAVAAAFVAGGGSGAVAASRYLVTSTAQISPRVLKALRGERGPAGPPGPTGATGAAGTNASLHEFEVTGTPTSVSASSPVATSTASCPAGDLVLSGGVADSDLTDATIAEDEPTTINGDQSWELVVVLDGSDEENFEAVAVCASS